MHMRKISFKTDRIHPMMGSALIGVVIAILVFSILAAAMVPMIGSSSRQTAAGLLAEKAYYMAESGFRYAASRYLHGGSSQVARNAVLDELDGNYTLSDGQSRFGLRVYSYFFEPINPASGTTLFNAHCPGSCPPDMTAIDGMVKIADAYYNIQGPIPIPGGGGDNVTIIVDNPLVLNPDPDQNIAYPATNISGVTTRTVNGNTIYDLQVDDASMFPRRNGRIQAGDVIWSYQFNNRSSNTLVDVRDTTTPGAAITVPLTPIALVPEVRVDATGSYGAGSLQVRREVVYYAPLQSGNTARQELFTERFETKSDWTDTSGTTTAVGQVAGNNALQVQAALTSGDDTASLTIFTPATAEAKRVDYDSARRVTLGYLSYDTQVKIGFDTTPVPDYYAAGLSFRLSNAGTAAGLFGSNGYGISFLRGSDSAADGIPDELVPAAIQSQKAIVLWQQTSDGARRRWLAYREMRDRFFDADNESNQQFHQLVGTRWDPHTGGRQHNGSTRNWYYGNDMTLTYNFGDTDFGVIESDSITLPSAVPITLAFWSWHETEPGRPDNAISGFDRKQVFVAVFEGGIWGPRQLVHTINRGPAPGDWYRETVDLSAYAGKTVRIQFGFNTVDNLNNNYEGWYVDDVQVYYDWPVQNSTMGVRLLEAMVVRFENGYPEIKVGSRIRGQVWNTHATVIAPPLLTQGDWSEANPARGVLLLNRPAVSNPTSAFSVGEALDVIGGSARQATVAAFDDASDRKANIIQAYYASEGQGGTGGNTDPLDLNTNPYPRLGPGDEPAWPPEVDGDGNWTNGDGNWTAADDYFRQIEWDAVNDGNVTGLSPIAFMTKDQGIVPNAVLQSHQADLQSPDYPALLSNEEIGLHALGAGATDTYFDDFSIRIDVAKSDAIPPPLQQ